MSEKKKPKRKWVKQYTLEELQELIPKQKTRSVGSFYLMKLKSLLKRKKTIKYRCQVCEIGPEWNGKKLSLELDHVDGDWRNNAIENLRFLCPMCHYQTETHSTISKTPEKIRTIPPADISWFKVWPKRIDGRKWESMRRHVIDGRLGVCDTCSIVPKRHIVREKRKRKTGQDLRLENLECLCVNCWTQSK